MGKTNVLSRLEDARQAFLKSFEDLPDSALFEAGVCGEWSIRDIMAHVTTWEAETLEALPLILENKRLPRYATKYGGVDAFNALQHEKKKKLSLAQVRRHLVSTHKRLVSYISDLPESAFTPRFIRRLRLDTYTHHREHTRQIEGWRTTRGL